jgi:hypothetical protein
MVLPSVYPLIVARTAVLPTQTNKYCIKHKPSKFETRSTSTKYSIYVKCYNTVRTTTSLQALVSVYHYQKMEYPRVAKTLGAGTRALRDVPPRRWYSGKYTQEKSVRDWVTIPERW